MIAASVLPLEVDLDFLLLYFMDKLTGRRDFETNKEKNVCQGMFDSHVAL